MKYTILRSGTFLKRVQPTGNVSTKIMDEELLTMNFSLDHYFNFKIGDTCTAFNTVFILQELPTVHKQATNHYNYTLSFTGIKYELGKIQLMFPDGNNNLTLGDFSINADAQTIIELIVQNANRISSGWSIGVVDVTEVRNFTFTATNLLAALAILAEEFKSEFWIDSNLAIHFQQRNHFSGLSLTYGQNNGLFSITRQALENTKIITRLYAFGSDKNISNGYRDGSPRLKLPNNYMEQNTNLYGIVEHTEIFEDIYPHRVGTVSHIDSSNPLKFRDTTIDFNLGGSLPNSTLIKTVSAERIKTSLKDLKLAETFDVNAMPVQQYVDQKNLTPVSVLIPGVAAKVTFNSGQLAGYTFDIAAGGWNNTTKEITLLRNTDEKALELPNDLMRPAVGDKYVITDIIMPQGYVVAAEGRLITAADAFLQKNSKPRLKYTVTPDHLYLRRNTIDLNIGDMVYFTDTDFGLASHLRITAIAKDLQNPYQVEFELSEEWIWRLEVAEIVEDIKMEILNKNRRRNVSDTLRIVDIKNEVTEHKFHKIGDLELLPVEGTLVTELGTVKVKAEELDFLKIPLDAPIRGIDEEKIHSWEFANEVAVKLGDVATEVPNWSISMNEQTNF